MSTLCYQRKRKPPLELRFRETRVKGSEERCKKYLKIPTRREKYGVECPYVLGLIKSWRLQNRMGRRFNGIAMTPVRGEPHGKHARAIHHGTLHVLCGQMSDDTPDVPIKSSSLPLAHWPTIRHCLYVAGHPLARQVRVSVRTYQFMKYKGTVPPQIIE